MVEVIPHYSFYQCLSSEERSRPLPLYLMPASTYLGFLDFSSPFSPPPYSLRLFNAALSPLRCLHKPRRPLEIAQNSAKMEFIHHCSLSFFVVRCNLGAREPRPICRIFSCDFLRCRSSATGSRRLTAAVAAREVKNAYDFSLADASILFLLVDLGRLDFF